MNIGGFEKLLANPIETLAHHKRFFEGRFEKWKCNMFKFTRSIKKVNHNAIKRKYATSKV